MEHRFTLEDYQGLQFRLDFYETDIIATRFGRTALSYRVDEKEVVAAFSVQRFGMMLPQNTRLVAQRGALKSISVYLPAAIYALFVDYGQANLALFNIPLPPLLFSLTWRGPRIERVNTFALRSKTWPASDDRLYAAPLPNVSAHSGRVCLGQVRLDPLRPPDDVPWIFQRVMASPFSNHDLGDKSKEFPENVLYRWHALHDRRETEYPLEDLVATRWTLAAYLDKVADPDDSPRPACAAALEQDRQSLTVNDMAARVAVNAIYSLLKFGTLNYFAVYFNSKDNFALPLYNTRANFQRILSGPASRPQSTPNPQEVSC